MLGWRSSDSASTSRRKLLASSGLLMRTTLTAQSAPRHVPRYVVPKLPSPRTDPSCTCRENKEACAPAVVKVWIRVPI